MNSSIKTVKGNYVIHFLQLLKPEQALQYPTPERIDTGYNQAIANAKPFGGRKFHNRSFGGGIAFNYQQEAETALEWANDMHLCRACRNEFVHHKGESCLACEEAEEAIQKEKDKQRQEDRERYSQMA